MKKRIEAFETIGDMPEYLSRKIEDTSDINVILVFYHTHDPENDYHRGWWYLVDNNSFSIQRYTFDEHESDGELVVKGTIVVIHH